MKNTSRNSRRTYLIVLLQICLYVDIVLTLPDGKVTIMIDNVYNPDGTTRNNRCCSGSLNTTTGICTDHCQTFVLFCISPGEGNPHGCAMGRKKTKVFGANSVKFPISGNVTRHVNRDHIQKTISADEYDNVLHFQIKETIRDEKLFKIFIKVYHVPLDQRLPEVQISEHIALATFSPHNIWTTFEAKQQYGPHVVFHVQTSCGENWGGDSCAYHCIPDDGRFGHWNCSNYRKICHFGWSGEFCNIPVCEQKCVHGKCFGPNECFCEHGWKGPACDICQTDRTCVHGTCTVPFQCDCDPDWSGMKCHLEKYPCRNNPCKNGARCTSKEGWIHGGVNCFCPPGYEGDFCEIRSPPCSSNPCLLGGTCIEVDSDNFTCVCPFGITGSNCDTDYINHCDPFPCHRENSVYCIDGNDRYTCKCKEGWSGMNCTEWDSCSTNPCAHAHRCDNIGSDYYCSCIEGWSGKNCNENRNDCEGQCRNNATCVDKLNEYKCVCPSGYSGKNCEIAINECSVSPCKNRGVCVDEINGYSCVCQTGFAGENCSLTVDLCESGPCLNGASCTAQHNDYHCTCSKEYTGRNCDSPLKFSIADLRTCKDSFCQHGSSCLVDFSKKEKCICSSGYTGKFCEKDIDDCLENQCQNSGTCVDRVDGYQCVCPNGFTGTQCETNVDECVPNPCQNGGTCKDKIDSYLCKCQRGYRGHDCTHNIDDCIGVTCENGGLCVDGIAEYMCKCRTGFTGKHCDIKGINWCYNEPCVHGKCYEKREGFDCVCDPGFTGGNCSVEINECLVVDCGNGQCIDKTNSHECECHAGYYGERCQFVDSCSKDPCFNNGACENKENDYVCDCPLGFTGKTCLQVEDSCMMAIFNVTSKSNVVVSKGLCGKHGKCVSTSHTEFSCDCQLGWSGERCHIVVDGCENNFCQKDATCVSDESGYNCICPGGFTGKYCYENIDECDEKPCQNNGTCIDLVNDFFCSCKGEWKGKTCNSKTSYCDPSPCNNNGKCVDLGNNFQCRCVDGFSGPTCSVTSSHCTNDSCLNGGTCVSTEMSFTCFCKPGFEGAQCKEDVNDCASNPCRNGGLCKDGANRFDCECVKGFFGVDCAYEVDECVSNPCPDGIECIDLIGAYKCKCSKGKRGLTCEEDATELSCRYVDQLFEHGESWQNDCNRCTCHNGTTDCTKVVCGPLNCYKNHYLNCSCRQKHDTDCLTPPCRQWGECGSFKTASISRGGCVPSNTEVNLSENCALLNINFEKVKLPVGILLEEICEEFRYSSALQQQAQHQHAKIALLCKRYTFDENMNEIIVSVSVDDGHATEVAVHLANYFQHEVSGDSVLHALNKTTVKVTVKRYAVVVVVEEKDSKMSLIVPIVGGVIALALLTLLITLVYSCVRKTNESRSQNEIFFTKKRNILKTDGDDFVKDCNIKSHTSKARHLDVQSDDYAPDKLYISEPSKKFYV